MVNASLAYEVLMYFNTFFFGMVAGVEIFFTIMKISEVVSADVVNRILPTLASVILLETTRLVLSKFGSLEEKKWQAFLSAGLTIPSAVCVILLANLDHVAKIEIIWCVLLLLLHAVEMYYVVRFLIQMRQPISYL